MSRQVTYRCDCCMASATERFHLGWLVLHGKDWCPKCHGCALGYGRMCVAQVAHDPRRAPPTPDGHKGES